MSDLRERLATSDLPLYGLPSRQAERRWVRTCGHDWITLAHRVRDAGVEVDTGAIRRESRFISVAGRTLEVGRDIRDTLTTELLVRKLEPSAESLRTSEQRDHWMAILADRQAGLPDWEPMCVTVDATRERLCGVRAGEDWIAYGERREAWFFVHVSRCAVGAARRSGGELEFGLVRIRDFEPYLSDPVA